MQTHSFGLVLSLLLVAPSARAAGTADYGRDIEPLLSNSCYTCHGPDETHREADLRLDVRSSAVDDCGVIVPGDPEGSELLRRLTTSDEFEKMPPEDSHKPALSDSQIKLVRGWIEEGAEYQDHWAYRPLERPAVPASTDDSWRRNAIDAFISQRYQVEGFEPSPEADRRTLIRRLTLDLTGLPPRSEDVEAFAQDDSPDAYDRLVNRLLESDHFGERMAVYWLDLVRYADSIGYHSDNPREVSLYRDYVIDAFNRNLPFDQFTIEQLAGDLLPDATTEQRIASGYNRLLQTTEEGGAQPKEYTAKYLADRVRNVSSVWLGVTMNCAECHNHKYDPFTLRDFYSLGAFFADVQEKPVGRRDQTLLPSPEQQARQQQLESAVAEAKRVHDEAEEEGKAAAKAELDKRQKELEQFKQTLPTTLVSISVKPRDVRVLPRGNWMDDSGDILLPATPASLPPLKAEGERASRLDLARWLVRKDNPLVARTMINRYWMLLFGRGLAATMEDMGAQGEWPTHPQLIDWLAAEYIESGWDTKHVLKLIVSSAAYRQSSTVDPEQRRRDPQNRWVARQSALRLDAEFVRDSALAVSGLLVPTVGGKSVNPYQPVGYWAQLNFPKRTWPQDHGEAIYRRGLYTHWQRSFLHPSLLAFDAPSREECTAQRPRSNTPLQALVLLNDPTYVEAARVFARRILEEGGDSVESKITFAYREALCRVPTDQEVSLLNGLLAEHLQQYKDDSEAAKRLVSIGEWESPEAETAVDVAAWTSVARVILNLPEFITRF